MITEVAQTLLLHAQRNWPECMDTMLWPFAVKVAIKRLNCLQVDLNGNTPNAKFFNIKNIPLNVNDYHTLGCPVYVLDSRSKWEPCSQIGVYLGHSPMHAGSVALVLNPQTGHVLPQFHDIFDNNFIIVPHTRDSTIPPTWNEMYKNSDKLATNEAFDLAELWFKKLTDNSNNPIIDPFSMGLVSNDAVKQPNLTSDCEGDNMVPANASVSNSMPRLHSETSKKAVSFVDAQPISTDANRPAPASKPTKGDQHSMPKLVNLCESGLQRSE